MLRQFDSLAFRPADILLPKDADMTKWAVVACDQFTSQPEYWQAVADTVGDAPSTLRLILPEAKLNDPDVDGHIAAINGAMKTYLDQGVFKTLTESLFYIERTQSDGKVRHGLIGMVDLDQYDFTPGSGALIRATEGTVLSRIPPRVRVRRDAPIELPHVMLLIDDPDRTVIEPLTAGTGAMEKLYDFDLQQGGGRRHPLGVDGRGRRHDHRVHPAGPAGRQRGGRRHVPGEGALLARDESVAAVEHLPLGPQQDAAALGLLQQGRLDKALQADPAVPAGHLILGVLGVAVEEAVQPRRRQDLGGDGGALGQGGVLQLADGAVGGDAVQQEHPAEKQAEQEDHRVMDQTAFSSAFLHGHLLRS